MNILDRIIIDPQLDTTLAQQLKQQIGWFIAAGQVLPGETLPSVRTAAERLGINLHTVRSAYQKLEADGLVETRQGSGTRVLPPDLRRLAGAAVNAPSHTVGVIVPMLESPFYQRFLDGVESVARQSHTLLFMLVSHEDPSEVQRYYFQLAARQVDGILLASHDDDLFVALEGWRGGAAEDAAPGPVRLPEQRPMPLVTVDWPPSRGYVVNLDQENAGYLATRHLLEHGHRRVGLITHTLELPNVTPLNKGYQRALLEAGVVYDPTLVAPIYGWDAQAGQEGARRLLGLAQPPTAVFTISDWMAFGAMDVFRAAGLRIPQEVAIASFNDLPAAELVTPGLTTVSAPAYQMGQEAMKILQSLVAGKRPAHRRLVLPSALVIRQSCGEH